MEDLMIVKVYKYGLKSPDVDTRNKIIEQMKLANNYYNSIIESERSRIINIRNEMSKFADIEMLEAWYRQCYDELDNSKAEIRKARKKTRSKSETVEQKNKVRELRDMSREILYLLGEARSRFKTDIQYKENVKKINDCTALQNKEIYHRFNDCYWATKNINKESADTATKTAKKNLPSFRGFHKSRAIGVQIIGGIKISDIGQCTMVQVDIPENLEIKRKRPVVNARIRIGSTGKGNRDPIWCELKMVMHRPFPSDCVVKWVKVVRKNIAGNEKWEIMFSLEIPTPLINHNNDGKSISLDVGWRRIGDYIRIGYMWDGKKSTEIKLPARMINSFDQVSNLQSIRDRELDATKEFLLKALSTAPKDWHEKYCKYLYLSKSHRKWSKFALQWRDDRWNGDDFEFEFIERWRKKEKHLWQYQENLRNQVLSSRTDFYRKIGAELSRKYNTLLIENINLTESQKKSNIESDNVDIMAMRRQQIMVAPHELIKCLTDAFAGRGLTVVKIDKENTTKKCNACGDIGEWENCEEMQHTCVACGIIWDRDLNAAKNIYDIWKNREHSGGNGIIEIINVEKDNKNSKWGKLGRHEKKKRSQS
jgi:transposase